MILTFNTTKVIKENWLRYNIEYQSIEYATQTQTIQIRNFFTSYGTDILQGSVIYEDNTFTNFTTSFSCPAPDTKLGVNILTPLVYNRVNPYVEYRENLPQLFLTRKAGHRVSAPSQSIFIDIMYYKFYVSIDHPSWLPTNYYGCQVDGYLCDIQFDSFTPSGNQTICLVGLVPIPTNVQFDNRNNVHLTIFDQVERKYDVFISSYPFTRITSSNSVNPNVTAIEVLPDPSYGPVSYTSQFTYATMINSTSITNYVAKVNTRYVYGASMKRVLGSPETTTVTVVPGRVSSSQYNYVYHSNGTGGYTEVGPSVNYYISKTLEWKSTYSTIQYESDSKSISTNN
ncbi:hypothetical protein SAMD00019534_052350 [Acytostelium subglobosum LB1]|uniref:hypothetical protein n=1 Tax=Acytostelium subglobosum LB1 TaxID=1410327 RepID=UPI000644CD0E|nr:hypothetical protein SAMD00019534_052350 [Acytostelium subglobosum LB1]GAM22060.1 hypothetical protein SAMD00019534_052350 [Acytostelium subglobosum LB1]|eukprot:XP_012755160.1 hypothetical protein SAMD00019534_052350 [Acytostelium subglobosum LB1]